MMIVRNYMAALYRVLSWAATAIDTWPEGDCFILQVTRTVLNDPLPAPQDEHIACPCSPWLRGLQHNKQLLFMAQRYSSCSKT